MTNISMTHGAFDNRLVIFTAIREYLASRYDKWLARRRTLRAQKEARDAFQHVLALDDHMLDDIGVTRANVEWAANQPLTTSASLELQRLRATNRSHTA